MRKWLGRIRAAVGMGAAAVQGAASARMNAYVPHRMFSSSAEEFSGSIVGRLLEQFPEVSDALRAARLFVVEFQIGEDIHLELAEPDRAVEVARDAADEAVRGLSDLPTDVTLLLIGMAYIPTARRLEGVDLKPSRGVYVGCLGFMEGGIDFLGADGTRVRSDDWAHARAYALELCGRFG